MHAPPPLLAGADVPLICHTARLQLLSDAEKILKALDKAQDDDAGGEAEDGDAGELVEGQPRGEAVVREGSGSVTVPCIAETAAPAAAWPRRLAAAARQRRRAA